MTVRNCGFIIIPEVDPRAATKTRKEEKALDILLAITTVICAVGWFKNRVHLYTALYYIVWKELKEPNRADWDYCCKQVIRKMLGIKDRTGI